MSSHTNLTARAARFSARHRKVAIGGWIAFVIASVVLGGMAGFKQSDGTGDGVGSSGRADAALDAAFPFEASETVIVQSGTQTASQAAFKDTVADTVRRLKAAEYVTSVERVATSRDRHSVLLAVALDTTEDDAPADAEAVLAVTQAAQQANPEFFVGQFGEGSLEAGFDTVMGEDMSRAELFSLPITLIILLVAFGSLVAAIIPLALAMSAVAATMGLTALASHVIPMDDTVNSVIVMIGLAVGIDYSLFYLRREREERAKGNGESASLIAAAATSGHAVVVSGITVMIAMAGMYLAGFEIFDSLATGAILMVAVALLASLSVLPALLSLLGDRVTKGRIPGLARRDGRESRLWNGILGPVLRRPLVALVISGGILVGLAIPALSLHTGQPDMDSVSGKVEVKEAYERIEAAFPGGSQPASLVVQAPDVTAPEVQAQLTALGQRLGAGELQMRVSKDRTVADVEVPIAGKGTDDVADAALVELRTKDLPATLGTLGGGVKADVTGITAGNKDFTDAMNERMPLVLGFVLGLAFLLLLVTFRSLVIPIKAIVLNLLSVGAAYGVLELWFDQPITSWLPMFLFVILFGLSMDYHVFIVSRIREGRLAGLSTSEAISTGIRSTAGVVTSAASIMVAVFAAFGTVSTIDMKQMGIGLAAAVLIDATIVRAVLLPAAMQLLGDWNWWMPGRRERPVPATA